MSSSTLTDQELSTRFEDIAKTVAKSSQGYFEDSQSLGKQIRLKLARIDLVASEAGDFGIPSSQTTMEADAASYLESFCNYTNSLTNITWDAAILITGRDLYLETSSNTNDYFVRGLANIGKVCSTDQNCLVIEGTQIHVAPILMTHELGHAMELSHDDMIEENDTCVAPNHLMSSSIDENFGLNFEHQWSKCSRAEIDTFLASSDANCLKIENSTEDLMLQEEIWNTFSFDDQCKFAYGGYYTKYNGRYQGRIIRDYTHCSQLYCWDDLTRLLKTLPGAPALSGTRCDMGRVCYMGRCIDENSIGPTERPTKNPSTVPGVIQNVCDSINNFVTSIINIFG